MGVAVTLGDRPPFATTLVGRGANGSCWVTAQLFRSMYRGLARDTVPLVPPGVRVCWCVSACGACGCRVVPKGVIDI